METIVYHREIHYYETDQMRIVHHSNYIRYFEEARMEMLDQLGLNYAKMEKAGLIVPVMFVDCQYLQPLLYGDSIQIHTRMTRFDGIKMEISYEIYKGEDMLLCTTGHSGHCFLDQEMKPVRMKRKYPDIYQKLKEIL